MSGFTSLPLKTPKERIAPVLILIHLQSTGFSLHLCYTPTQHASDFSKLRFSQEYD